MICCAHSHFTNTPGDTSILSGMYTLPASHNGSTALRRSALFLCRLDGDQAAYLVSHDANDRWTVGFVLDKLCNCIRVLAVPLIDIVHRFDNIHSAAFVVNEVVIRPRFRPYMPCDGVCAVCIL